MAVSVTIPPNGVTVEPNGGRVLIQHTPLAAGDVHEFNSPADVLAWVQGQDSDADAVRELLLRLLVVIARRRTATNAQLVAFLNAGRTLTFDPTATPPLVLS
jgi:hypothetical protein